MNIGQYFAEAFAVLAANRVRSLLTVTGLIIGVTAVIAIQVLGAGMAGAVGGLLGGLSDRTFIVFPNIAGQLHPRLDQAGRPEPRQGRGSEHRGRDAGRRSAAARDLRPRAPPHHVRRRFRRAVRDLDAAALRPQAQRGRHRRRPPRRGGLGSRLHQVRDGRRSDGQLDPRRRPAVHDRRRARNRQERDPAAQLQLGRHHPVPDLRALFRARQRDRVRALLDERRVEGRADRGRHAELAAASQRRARRVRNLRPQGVQQERRRARSPGSRSSSR